MNDAVFVSPKPKVDESEALISGAALPHSVHESIKILAATEMPELAHSMRWDALVKKYRPFLRKTVRIM